MAFTSVSLTGTVKLSNSTPAAGASVNLTLSTPITDGTVFVAPETISTRCAADGTFTIAVNANDDSTTQPTGTYYSVVIGYGSQTLDSFNVVVLHADSPTVNLFTLATLPNPNVVSPYVSQLTAGTGITLSPTGGTGAVQITSTGDSGVSTGTTVTGASDSALMVTDSSGKLQSGLSVGSVAELDSTGHLTPSQAQVASVLKNSPAVRPIKRDLLILDNNAGGNGATNSSQILPEQFIPDMTTGAMYMLYFGNGTGLPGVCLAKATGSPAAPASPDPTVNTFSDLGPLQSAAANIGADSAHLVIANNTYFLFTASNTAAGSSIYVYTAPQITAGVIVPLESAVWSAFSICCYPAAENVTALTPTQGGAGTLPNSLQTFVVTAVDHDGLESGTTTTTFTPTASSEVVLTWTAPTFGETNGYYVYRNAQRIATIAHGTVTYTVTGSETLGVAPPAYTSSSCVRLDEMFVFYDSVAGQWRMLLMGFNQAASMEQVHLANLSASGYAALTSAAHSFVKQNNSQPVIPAGNYAQIFGATIPGGAGMATLYDYECAADPFVFRIGSYFVIGYAAGAQGSIADTGAYRVALAYTKDFATFTKIGVMHYPSAAKNPADASNGAALDGRGQNRASCGSWRGSMYVDANGIGHMSRCAKVANGGNAVTSQAYYYQYDLSGIPDVLLGLRNIDPWIQVEAESSDARLTHTGFASVSSAEVYFSGGAIAGSGGECRYTTNPGDTLTFTFLGSAVRVLMGRVSTTGTVTITLDGGGTEGVNQFTALDLTSTVSSAWTTIFAAQFDDLPPGVHQIKLTAVTTGSSGIFVDRFDYIPLSGLLA